MNKNTRRLTITALLAGLTFLLGLTPIGFVPNPIMPVLSLTLMCLPIIIGTIMEGLKMGLLLSLVFGVTSLFKAIGLTMAPDPLGTYLLQVSTIKTLIIIFIPRLFIPISTWLVYKAINGESKMRQRVATGVAAFVGSVTNTVLFLGALYLVFLPEIAELSAAFTGMEGIVGYSVTPNTLFNVYLFLAGINGLPEAIVAVVLCVPIVYALNKIKKKSIRNMER